MLTAWRPSVLSPLLKATNYIFLVAFNQLLLSIVQIQGSSIVPEPVNSTDGLRDMTGLTP